MKIMVIFHDNNLFSGATKSMLSLIQTWKKKNIDIFAIVPKGGGLSEKLNELNIRFITTPNFKTRINHEHSFFKQILSYCFSFFSIITLKIYVKSHLSSLLKKEKIDVIYSNTTAVMLGYYLNNYLNCFHVWHIREFGLEDQNTSFVFGKKDLCKKLSKANLVVAISEAVKKAYCDVTAPIIVAYNDISKVYDCNYQRNWNKETINVLSCGSLIRGKGHADAVKAIIKLRRRGEKVELFIAGTGMEKDSLLKLVIDNNATEYIHLLGHVADMNSLRKRCEIGIVASTMEAFGRVTVEGMLSGLCMIGANSGGTAELIEDGVTGLLFEPGNPNDLAEKIKILYFDRNKARMLSENGYQASRKFTQGICAEKIINEIQLLRLGGEH